MALFVDKLERHVIIQPKGEYIMLNIIITERAGDIHVQVEGKVGVWGCGKTIYEAIGNLVFNHKEVFNIGVTFGEK